MCTNCPGPVCSDLALQVTPAAAYLLHTTAWLAQLWLAVAPAVKLLPVRHRLYATVCSTLSACQDSLGHCSHCTAVRPAWQARESPCLERSVLLT